MTTASLTGQWIPLKTILFSEVRRFVAIWNVTLLTPALSAAMYLLVFGGLFGDRIGQVAGQGYLSFIIPGIILMSVIVGAYENASFSVFLARFDHYIEEMLVSPVNEATILLGYILGGITRAMIVAISVAMVTWFFEPPRLHDLLFLLVTLVLTASLFSLGGFINGLNARTWDDIAVIPTFVLTPLTYLGGVFYSINQLPDWGQTLSLMNPIVYMVSGFRYALLGISDFQPLVSLAVLLVLNLLLFIYALRALRLGTGIKD